MHDHTGTRQNERLFVPLQDGTDRSLVLFLLYSNNGITFFKVPVIYR